MQYMCAHLKNMAKYPSHIPLGPPASISSAQMQAHSGWVGSEQQHVGGLSFPLNLLRLSSTTRIISKKPLKSLSQVGFSRNRDQDRNLDACDIQMKGSSEKGSRGKQEGSSNGAEQEYALHQDTSSAQSQALELFCNMVLSL